MRARPYLVLAATLAAIALPAAARAQPEKSAGARADELAEIGGRLAELRDEVANLGKDIEAPDRSPAAARARASRKLIDAQVALGTGDHDAAAVLLYEFVEDHPQSRSYDAALFYLAEALFQRDDHLTSRERFTELMQRIGPASRFYQQALERLVELSLALRDDTDVERWLAALDRVPPAQLRPSVHYVRGKYAYSRDRFQDAVQHFGQVPLDTDYFFQARYFMGVCYVALGSLQNAEAVYRDLVAREPQRKTQGQPGAAGVAVTASAADADQIHRDALRVIELSHLALGRIFYETDRLAEAVDAYLEVDRKSDLFEDAAYEIAWVFVKLKQFDKALLAIELLARIAPGTSLVPSVEILEGNLRIRKAQALSVVDSRESAAEYKRALATFEETRERFAVAHEELGRVMADRLDARMFLDQLAGRTAETFEVRATLPEVAAAWLRQEPGVQRVVSVEQDLEQIAGDVRTSERAIERLEHALAEPSRSSVFPELAKKRVRGVEIMEEVFALRRRIALAERSLIFRHAGEDERATLAELELRREALARELASLPSGEVAHGERIARARNAVAALGEDTAETTRVIDAATAKLVALDKYLHDRDHKDSKAASHKDSKTDSKTAKPAEATAEARKDMAEVREELAALRGELDRLRRDTTLAKDRAGTGDEAALRGQSLRVELRRALENEQGLMLRIAGRMDGGDRERGQAIATLLSGAQELTGDVDALERLIDEVVEVALEDARSALVEEKARLAVIKRELGDHEAEARELGGAVVSASFAAAKQKLYEILVRADVGVVDVGWSKKEDGDEAVRRVNLDRLREERMMEDELRLLFGDDAVGGKERKPDGASNQGGEDGP
jgi:tetratricopeptide (TPR) repeat protein